MVELLPRSVTRLAYDISDSIKHSISLHIKQLRSLDSHRKLRTLPNYAPKFRARTSRLITWWGNRFRAIPSMSCAYSRVLKLESTAMFRRKIFVVFTKIGRPFLVMLCCSQNWLATDVGNYVHSLIALIWKLITISIYILFCLLCLRFRLNWT